VTLEETHVVKRLSQEKDAPEGGERDGAEEGVREGASHAGIIAFRSARIQGAPTQRFQWDSMRAGSAPPPCTQKR
jgi:hypothetical protein